ncbi:MAG: hypothetical protein NTX75_15810 [Proteobacteria bacterium]|nr:hypothetical protein [Pseudomonadota bacterium]
MANISCSLHQCPFTRKACTDCSVYRGRHHFIASFRQGDGHNNGQKEQLAAYFQAVEKQLNPWDDSESITKDAPTIRLEVVDAESSKARYCVTDEAKTWDWGDPGTMRIIGDRQVTSFKHLIDILRYKESQGDQEVKLYEFPRFMFLAGG